MTNRRIRCAAAVALLTFTGLLCPIHVSAESTDKPNIVFIMADDLGYGDLGCYGQELIQTPHIDRLASEGLRFTQAYAGSTVCAASRGVLMTGKHNGHCVVRDNIPHYPTYLQEEDLTIAEVLKQAGYRCGGVGKWSLGDAGTVGRATRQGFDMWLGYLNQDHAHYYFTDYLDDNDRRMELPGNALSRAHYSHDLLATRTLDYLRESKEGPFFFYAAFTLPHFSSPSEDETCLAVPTDEPYTRREWTQAEKNYAAMVTKLDRDVGRIVQLIEELGMTDDTLIIFTSDNGPWGPAPKRFKSSGPLRGVKRDLYEGGIRVPFIARWPKHIPAGQQSDTVIAFQDMLPTFAELAGAAAPRDIDGLSLTAAFRGERIGEPRDYLYWDYGHCRQRYDQAVRLGDWKGIRLGQETSIQLYDLATDIREENDVASQRPDIVRKIEDVMSTAVTPSDRYPIGELYQGQAIWRNEIHP